MGVRDDSDDRRRVPETEVHALAIATSPGRVQRPSVGTGTVERVGDPAMEAGPLGTRQVGG
jgi:hypothetical protein